jgi:hypothetical protein
MRREVEREKRREGRERREREQYLETCLPCSGEEGEGDGDGLVLPMSSFSLSIDNTSIDLKMLATGRFSTLAALAATSRAAAPCLICPSSCTASVRSNKVLPLPPSASRSKDVSFESW